MDERTHLFNKVQLALAGHSEREVAHVLLTSLLIEIGVGAENLPKAIAVIDALPTELKPLLRERWGEFRRHRAQAELQRSTEEGEQTH